MAALGIGLAYAGYCGVLWGVCLVTGKNVGVKQLFGAKWPPSVPGVAAPSTVATGAGAGKVPPAVQAGP